METSVEEYLRVKMWNVSDILWIFGRYFLLLTGKSSGLNWEN